MAYLSIRNWKRYQHYKERRPPWIKFYVDILDDEELLELPAWTQLLWDRLLLLAAKKDNAIPKNSEWICSRTGIPLEACSEGIDQLLKGRWLLETRTKRRASKGASNSASKFARPETETETELGAVSPTRDPAADNGASNSPEVDLSDFQTPTLRSIP